VVYRRGTEDESKYHLLLPATSSLEPRSLTTPNKQVTQAYTDLGINSASGAIYFFNRLSPREAAHKKWKIPYDKIKPEQLPDLSSSSDFAWGYWNREHSDGVGLENIKFIFMCSIVNEVTLALIDRALKTYPLPPGVTERPKEVQAWPGTTFEMEYDAAQVLLGMLIGVPWGEGVCWLCGLIGSPNGQAAGFFLSQHKHRFGKSKSVDKITVFCPDSGGHPYLLFWVIDAPTVPDKGDADFGDNDSGYDSGAEVVEGNGRTDSAVFLPDVMNRTLRHEVEHRILKVGEDGKNVVREHVFRAKLWDDKSSRKRKSRWAPHNKKREQKFPVICAMFLLLEGRVVVVVGSSIPTKKMTKKPPKTKIPVDTPAHTCPPTLVGVIQRRRPMVNARLQNFFPRLIAFIA
jgi:hypothetical protein